MRDLYSGKVSKKDQEVSANLKINQWEIYKIRQVLNKTHLFSTDYFPYLVLYPILSATDALQKIPCIRKLSDNKSQICLHLHESK